MRSRGMSQIDIAHELQVPQMNFDVVNNTNSTETATATVTIPVCDGVVPGPCLDKTTGQIIP
jgi:transcriptional regulator